MYHFLYFLYHWSLGNQRRCSDLLFIITKPRTTKWACTDSSTLTYTIIKQTTGGILQGNKPFFSVFKWRLARTQIPLFTPGSVHSSLASWDDCCWLFPDKLHVSSFFDRFLYYPWIAAWSAHSNSIWSRVHACIGVTCHLHWRKFPCHFCQDSKWQPFNHESSALPTRYTSTPSLTYYRINKENLWQHWTFGRGDLHFWLTVPTIGNCQGKYGVLQWREQWSASVQLNRKRWGVLINTYNRENMECITVAVEVETDGVSQCGCGGSVSMQLEKKDECVTLVLVEQTVCIRVAAEKRWSVFL